jgi:vitamin B12/bleomycin/antimicrobial peptide transport system ATP-binding/permease protein
VQVPWHDREVLFLPQKTYLPMGTLREAVCYPAKPDAFDNATILAALDKVKLPQLTARLDEVGAWDKQLSPGEQQRVALARAMLIQPKWLFMDEATAALDAATAQSLTAMLFEQLPQSAIVSIAHDPAIVAMHAKRAELQLADGGAVLRAL